MWATQGLERVLDRCADVFESDTDKFGRTTFWLPLVGAGKLSGLEIEIAPARVFRSRDGREVSWNPIRVVAALDPRRLATHQALDENEQEHQAEQRAREQSRLLEAPAPNPKNTKKTLDLPSGEYLCRRYASTTFRGALRDLLFLVPAGEDGEPATDEETPTYGHFLEGGDRGDWRHGGAAKGICPPALLPGRGADNAEKEGPPGHPCGSSLRGRRLGHHGPAIDAKHHLSSIPHGVELPEFPPQPFFGRFCGNMPQHGRAALSSRRALQVLERLPSAPLSYAFCRSRNGSKGRRGGQPLLRTISISGLILQQPFTFKCHIAPGYSMWKGPAPPPAPPPVGPWRTPRQGSGTPPRQGSGATGRANGPGISNPKRGLRTDKQLPACAPRGPDHARGRNRFPGGLY